MPVQGPGFAEVHEVQDQFLPCQAANNTKREDFCYRDVSVHTTNPLLAALPDTNQQTELAAGDRLAASKAKVMQQCCWRQLPGTEAKAGQSCT